MSSFQQRAITAFFFVIAMIGGTLWHSNSYILLYSIIAILSAWEFLRIALGEHKTYQIPGLITALIPIAMVVGSMYFNLPDIATISVVGGALFLIFLASLGYTKGNPFAPIAQIALATIYIGWPMSLAIKIGFMQGSFTPWILLGVIFIIWMNDSGAYMVGSRIGKTAFAKRISPNKTWEGTVGGWVVSVGTAALLSHFVGILPLSTWLIIGITVAILGALGDLVESMLKRNFGIKDSGTLLPGHGGFLDRFDSFIFVMPFVYFILYIS